MGRKLDSERNNVHSALTVSHVSQKQRSVVKNFIDHLVKFGFVYQDGLVYAFLLQHGRLTVQQLLHASRTDPSELDSSLTKLCQFCLVTEVASDGGRCFRAVDPQLSWQAFGYAALWQTAESPTKPFDRNESADPKLIQIRVITSAAQALYKSKADKVSRYRKAYDSVEEFSLDCGQALMSAQREVVASETSPRRLQTSLFWPSIVSMRERGVVYTRYCDIEEICMHGIDVVRRDVHEMNIKICVVPRRIRRHSFFIVDGLVMFVHKYSEASAAKFHGTCSKNSGLIGRYLGEQIPALSKQSMLFQDIVSDLEQNIANKRTILKMENQSGSIEAVFNKIVSLGKFAPLSVLERKIADDLCGFGCLRKNAEGYCVSLEGSGLEQLELS